MQFFLHKSIISILLTIFTPWFYTDDLTTLSYLQIFFTPIEPITSTIEMLVWGELFGIILYGGQFIIKYCFFRLILIGETNPLRRKIGFFKLILATALLYVLAIAVSTIIA